MAPPSIEIRIDPNAYYTVGNFCFGAAVDGYSRLAYTEALGDEKAVTARGFMDRARAFCRAHGIHRPHSAAGNRPQPAASAPASPTSSTVSLRQPGQYPHRDPAGSTCAATGNQSDRSPRRTPVAGSQALRRDQRGDQSSCVPIEYNMTTRWPIHAKSTDQRDHRSRSPVGALRNTECGEDCLLPTS